MGTGESILGNRLRAQTEIHVKQAWLLRLLETKYRGEVTSDVAQLVEQQADVSLLNQWFEFGLEESTFEGFVQRLK